jgi:hypothetical protein
MEPVSRLILTIDAGARTLAMVQRLVHHVTQVLAPACAPLLLTDSVRDSLTALVPQDGQWMQAERRQGTGPLHTSRWMPWPQLLCAQVVTSSACRTPRGRLSSGYWPRAAGRATQPLSSASPWTCASRSRPFGSGATYCARTKLAYASNWRSSTPITPACCLMPACARPCLLWPKGRRQSRDGSSGRPPGPLA